MPAGREQEYFRALPQAQQALAAAKYLGAEATPESISRAIAQASQNATVARSVMQHIDPAGDSDALSSIDATINRGDAPSPFDQGPVDASQGLPGGDVAIDNDPSFPWGTAAGAAALGAGAYAASRGGRAGTPDVDPNADPNAVRGGQPDPGQNIATTPNEFGANTAPDGTQPLEGELLDPEPQAAQPDRTRVSIDPITGEVIYPELAGPQGALPPPQGPAALPPPQKALPQPPMPDFSRILRNLR